MHPWEYEALSWLRSNKNQHALATNKFQTTAEAIKAIERLYAAGATLVKVGPVLDEPERVEREGGPYTTGFVVLFPKAKTSSILVVVRTLAPEEGQGTADDVYLDDETQSPALMLTWD